MIEQQPGGTTNQSARRVEGRVVRGVREGQKPVANQWVTLHRVGHDRQGPLDSTRTNAAGAYSMTYHTSGDSTALYFVSTTYGGVAYFTSPLRDEVVRGEPASMTVFDTTSGPVAIRVAGRHLIVGAPQANGRRPIGEVFDLENDSTVTVVARDSASPVWTTHIPTSAVGFQLNTNGDLANGSIARNGSTVGVLVPISPGIRQIAFTYELPSNAFPWSVPVERPTGILEVLVQEPTARITGAKFRETAPAEVEGRTFRRLLAQDVPVNSVIQIDVPRMIGAEREKVYIGVASLLLAAMAAALVLTARRAFTRTRAASVAPRSELRSEALLREIARLDEEFERAPADDAAKAAYEARRAELKDQLMSTLAAERKRS